MKYPDDDLEKYECHAQSVREMPSGRFATNPHCWIVKRISRDTEGRRYHRYICEVHTCIGQWNAEEMANRIVGLLTQDECNDR